MLIYIFVAYFLPLIVCIIATVHTAYEEGLTLKHMLQFAMFTIIPVMNMAFMIAYINFIWEHIENQQIIKPKSQRNQK